MKDYSQFGEQTAILAALDSSPVGSFLDVGAWHPEQFSNTRALFELGWSGVCIEPSPGPMLSLLEAYGDEPRIRLIQAAVAIYSGLVEIHVTDDAVSTSSADVFEQWKGTAAYRGKMLVPAITFEQISNQFGGFSFVNIDAEGLSVDLFHRMLALGKMPRCICVEHDSRMSELCARATASGYKLTLSNGTNAVFVR